MIKKYKIKTLAIKLCERLQKPKWLLISVFMQSMIVAIMAFVVEILLGTQVIDYLQVPF